MLVLRRYVDDFHLLLFHELPEEVSGGARRYASSSSSRSGASQSGSSPRCPRTRGNTGAAALGSTGGGRKHATPTGGDGNGSSGEGKRLLTITTKGQETMQSTTSKFSYVVVATNADRPQQLQHNRDAHTAVKLGQAHSPRPSADTATSNDKATGLTKNEQIE